MTGAGGFIGSAAGRALAAAGDRVVGFGRKEPLAPEPAFMAFVPNGLAQDILEQALDRHGRPDWVFHFAGAPTVGASFGAPLDDFESNVATTARLLDTLRCHAPQAQVVLASSAAVYGGGYRDAIPVDAIPAPASPYGHHKLMAESLGRAFAESYGMRVTVLRLFSVYGPGIRKQLIYDLCCRLERGENPLVLGGTGGERRDWCHVEDVATLCATLPAAPAGRPALFNVGSGSATDIADVARIVVEAWGTGRSVRFSGESRRGDPFSLVASRGSLPPNFTPSRNLRTGLEEYVSWFRRQSA